LFVKQFGPILEVILLPEFDRQELFQRVLLQIRMFWSTLIMEVVRSVIQDSPILEAYWHHRWLWFLDQPVYTIVNASQPTVMVVDGETGYLLCRQYLNGLRLFVPDWSDNIVYEKRAVVSMIRRMDQGPYIEAPFR